MLFQRKALPRSISEGRIVNNSAILKHFCTLENGTVSHPQGDPESLSCDDWLFALVYIISMKSTSKKHIRRPSWQYECNFKALLHILKSAPWVVLRALWNGQARAAYFLHWAKAFSKKSMFQRHVRRPSWQYQCSFKALWHILTSAEIGTVSRPRGDPESLIWGGLLFALV